jgi:hypothetical protein
MALHARIFGETAKAHTRASRFWLWVSGAMTALAITWLWTAPGFLDLTSNPPHTRYVIYFFGNTVLLGLALYCGRVFRSERHNTVVNQHRHDALTTYEAIIDGASGDEQMRAAIIMHATQTIFAPQPTGYWESKSQPGDQVPLPILQLIGEATKAAKKGDGT